MSNDRIFKNKAVYRQRLLRTIIDELKLWSQLSGKNQESLKSRNCGQSCNIIDDLKLAFTFFESKNKNVLRCLALVIVIVLLELYACTLCSFRI
jgi:hypothetical protein